MNTTDTGAPALFDGWRYQNGRTERVVDAMPFDLIENCFRLDRHDLEWAIEEFGRCDQVAFPDVSRERERWLTWLPAGSPAPVL